MNQYQDDDDAWYECNDDDLWIFDKLILSRKLGYICGPAGAYVPQPCRYIVRPCVNTEGLGRGARYEWLEKDTDFLPAGYFWCQVFEGRHISVDYTNQQQGLTVEGFRKSWDPIYKFYKWKKINDEVKFPDVFKHLKYKYINIEFIDEHIIEIHLRHNSDFCDGDQEILPVWEEDQKCPDGYKFRKNSDGKRLGFFYR